MRGINSDSVDLIYLDPPFNSNRNYESPIGSEAAGAAFKDTWTLSDVDVAWIGLIAEESPALASIIESAGLAHGKGMQSYLTMMAVRLLEMKRMLKPDGSIYLHCDPTASHYLKLVMDCVLRQSSFMNEVVWKRTSSHNSAKRWGPVHDTILFYGGGGKIAWNRVLQPLDPDYVERYYCFEDTRGKYQSSDLTGSGTRNGQSGQDWSGYDPTLIGRHWAVPPNRSLPEWFVFPAGYDGMAVQKRLDALESQGLVHWPDNGQMPRFKRYLTAKSGAPVQDIVLDIRPLSKRQRESLGYPTQKPLALLERIIQASSNEGDVVLDPFCGCATALVAADKLDRQWIGIDLSPKAIDLVKLRLDRLLGPLYRPDMVTARTDIPQRTDVGKIPPYKTHRHTLYGKQEGLCAGCKQHFPFRNFTVDHIVPRSKGGTDHLDNLQLLCGACNSTKGTIDQAAFVVKLKSQGIRN